MQNLSQLRRQIDRLDNRIVALLNRRLKLAERVGDFKALNDGRVYDRRRERELMARLSARHRGPLQDKELREIYRHIFRASREHQRRVLKTPGIS